MPRFEPYTARGVKRVPCVRCGNLGHAHWNICADNIGNRKQYRSICKECDIELNAMVMRWVWGDSREADIAAYADRVRTT